MACVYAPAGVVLLNWLANNFWWLILFLFVFFSGSGTLERILGRQRRISRMKGELENSLHMQKAVTRENKRLHGMVERLLSGGPPEACAHWTGPDPHHLLDLLRRVQATDVVVPQLPQQLRADIDATLSPTVEEDHGET